MSIRQLFFIATALVTQLLQGTAASAASASLTSTSRRSPNSGQPPRTIFCREKAGQVAAFLTVVNDPTASLEGLSPQLVNSEPQGRGEEDYGTEEWTVSVGNQAPVTIRFRVVGGDCDVQEVSVAGL